MRKSIATVCLSGMLRDKLEAIAAARFEAVELFENDLLQFPGPPREARRLADDLGLAIDLYQPFRDFEGVGAAQLARNLDRAERKFDVMQELGAPLLLVCSNVAPEASDEPGRLAEQLRALAERAARRGLRIGYEALAWGRTTSRFGQAWDAVQRADHPHLGLILDSFHTLAIGDDYAGIAALPGDKIFFVQLADAPRMKLDVLEHSRHFRCFPGQGELDVSGFLDAVIDSGYAAAVSLEVFNDNFRAAPNRATAVDAMRSLLWLEERVRARRQSRGEAPSRRAALFDPPPAPALHGWPFVEFAVDASAESRLRPFLEALGFARIGGHRSKAVDLYGQGEVRIVLNREEDSFARSHFDLHGPSVCAIALATEDAAAALSRAQALGCSQVAGRVGPNELAIPAVRAPDDSLLYFLDVRRGGPHGFEQDFTLDPAQPSGEPLGAAARIDHVAQVLPVRRLDAWVLFYRAVLGLEPTPGVVLHDPYGLIRSCAMESSDKAVRYPLNVSDADDTAAGRSLARFAGAGVHHIAIAVEDALAAARALRARAVPILPVPANYYDDIAARFDLDPVLLAELRANDVFYDRDADGEYLHLYTAPFDGRFFFEAVERRGGYAQYGAANAPVRLAALAQWRTAQAQP